MTGICAACKKHGSIDSCHIKSRGAGGPNEGFNLIFMCRHDHSDQHRWGWGKFLQKYPNLKKDLKSRGWSMEIVLGRHRLSHPRLR